MRLYKVGVESLISVLACVRRLGSMDVGGIVRYTGLSRSTVDKCLRNAVELGLVALEGEQYRLGSSVGPINSEDELADLVRAALQNSRLFQVTCEFLNGGVSAESSLRRALMVIGDTSSQLADVSPILYLGTACGVLVRDGDQYKIASAIDVKQRQTGVAESLADLDSEMAALLYLSRQFGSELFNTLDINEQKRLVEAVLCIATQPEQACEKAGKVLENYLRLIGTAAGSDMSGFDGLGQLADCLAAKERLLIHPKHREVAKGIAALRNCTAHDRDKITNMPWHISPEIAACTVQTVIRLIVSIASWAHRGHQQTL